MSHVTKNVGLCGLLSPLLKKWRFKEIAKWISGDSVLDVGCGTGEILEYLPLISKYTGIDADEKVIEKSKLRKTSFNKDYFVLQIGKEKLDLNEKYSTIIMSAFIEHLDNPLEILEELKNILKSNGRIIITTPSPKSKLILEIGSKFKLFSDEAFHEHRDLFSETSLICLMEKAELEIIHYNKFEFNLNQIIVVKHNV